MLAELSGRVDHDLCCNSSELQPHHGRVNDLIRRWTKPDHLVGCAAHHTSLQTPTVWGPWSSASATNARIAALEGASFVLGQSAPDSGLLAGVNSPRQASLGDLAVTQILSTSRFNRGPAGRERACDPQPQALHADAPTPGFALARPATAITRPHPPLRRRAGQSGSATRPHQRPQRPQMRPPSQRDIIIRGESPAVEPAPTTAAPHQRQRPTPTPPAQGPSPPGRPAVLP